MGVGGCVPSCWAPACRRELSQPCPGSRASPSVVTAGQVNELARDRQEGRQDRSGKPAPLPAPTHAGCYLLQGPLIPFVNSRVLEWAPHGLSPFSPTSHNLLYQAPLNKREAGVGAAVYREGGGRQVLG